MYGLYCKTTDTLLCWDEYVDEFTLHNDSNGTPWLVPELEQAVKVRNGCSLWNDTGSSYYNPNNDYYPHELEVVKVDLNFYQVFEDNEEFESED